MTYPFKLSRIFAVASLTALAGCASTPSLNQESCMEENKTTVLFGLLASGQRSFNSSCALQNGAIQMLSSDDIGLKAVGHSVLQAEQGPVREAAEVVREVIREETSGALDCTVQSVASGSDGKRVVRLGNCKPVLP